MDQNEDLFTEIMEILGKRLGDKVENYTVPPPVFTAMGGKFITFDSDGGSLTVQFPVLGSQLNPYGTMQGGMVAAAVDNTLGPLSMLVAPPNVTRKMEITYNRPVRLEIGYIIVQATFIEKVDHWLSFKAVVTSPEGSRLARAKAVHWILDT